MRYLGIDYGKRKIGLSISEGEIADPLITIKVQSLAQALDKINQIIRTEFIDKIVIGLPESGEARNLVKKFIQEFKGHSSLEIVEHPETLTTFHSKESVLKFGVDRSREDAFAAALILQDYLDEKP